MADDIHDLSERGSVGEGRRGTVESSLEKLEVSMDARFDEVHAAIVEQRRYTEFAYDHLVARLDAGFARLGAEMNSGFARVDERFERMDGRFARLERKLDQFIDRVLPPEPRAD